MDKGLVRVLSVRQPWSGAFFLHGKDVENRSWKTDYRGPLVIHASGGATCDDPRGLLAKKPDSNAWEYGALIGIVTLVDCVFDQSKSGWAVAGAWHWMIKKPELFTRPIQMKGKLNLWSVPTSLVLPVLK